MHGHFVDATCDHLHRHPKGKAWFYSETKSELDLPLRVCAAERQKPSEARDFAFLEGGGVKLRHARRLT
jgi:hypothetical protein